MAIPSRLASVKAREGFDPSWLALTSSDIWERNATSPAGNRTAIVDTRNRLSWLEANRWINRIAAGLLSLGCSRDDRIVVQLPNCVELPLIRISCERAGLICLPIARYLGKNEVQHILKKVKARVFISRWRFRSQDYFEMISQIRLEVPVEHLVMVEQDVPEGVVRFGSFLEDTKSDAAYPALFEKTRCAPEEFSLVTHTTGTTGFPKFVENPIFTKIEGAKAQIRNVGMSDLDVTAAVSPASGGPNLLVYYASPLVGAKVVMVEHFDAGEMLRLIEEEGITILPLVPTMILKMIDDPRLKEYDLGSLRMIVSAGAVLNYHDGVKAEEKLGCPVIQQYGSVDCGTVVMGSPEDSEVHRLGTVGRPLGRCRVKIVKGDGSTALPGEPGQVCMTSADCATGYFMDPEANRAAWDGDGWFNLGDLGKLEDDGYLTIMGREKEMIIRGGQNIIPAEIEEVFARHHKVARVAVIGIPDRVMGERAVACVVLRPGTQMSLDEITLFLKEAGMAAFKIPERLVVLNELPLLNEKVDKKTLSKQVVDRIGGSQRETDDAV
jgi:acyl-CoA synthetase (AMP-forming)/AMP-acid ligase II